MCKKSLLGQEQHSILSSGAEVPSPTISRVGAQVAWSAVLYFLVSGLRPPREKPSKPCQWSRTQAIKTFPIQPPCLARGGQLQTPHQHATLLDPSKFGATLKNALLDAINENCATAHTHTPTMCIPLVMTDLPQLRSASEPASLGS